MQRLILLAALTSAWGWSSLHRDASFLHHAAGHGSTPPAEPAAVEDLSAAEMEGVGPNMNFAPVSTTMKCTISLTLQYMAVFTALGIYRSYLDFRCVPYEESKVQKVLKHASETVFYAPMSCLLFVAVRMRVLQLTQGTGSPQLWVQVAMLAITYAILVNTLMVLVLPFFIQDSADMVDSRTGDPKLTGSVCSNQIFATIFTMIRYTCFLCLYVGFGLVVYGVFEFTPAKGVWEGPIPEVSPAVYCTCLMSFAFFTIYFLLALSRIFSQFAVPPVETRFEQVMVAAADTLAMAPMFCVLFLAARMRALQMDPVGGNPQPWAQDCFYMVTYALMAQTSLAMLVPLWLGGEVKKGSVEGDMEVVLPEETRNSILPKVLSGLRWFVMVCIYVAGSAIVCSVFTLQSPRGAEHTPPLSPTMMCVINLAFQYFVIYLLVWIFYTVKHFSGWSGLDTVSDAVESAKATVQFAPMLSVLFIATRMRALQITNQRGAPQGYVQDGMFLASWAVVVQFVMCLFMPFLTGKKFSVQSLAAEKDKEDGDSGAGPPRPKEAEKKPKEGEASGQSQLGLTLFKIAGFIRYGALVALLGGLVAIIYGVFSMTPDNANGRGTLVGEPIPRPPMATDMPGMEKAMEQTGESIGSGVQVVADGSRHTTGAVTDVADKAQNAAESAATDATNAAAQTAQKAQASKEEEEAKEKKE